MTRRLILLGDSIFDNGAYVGPGEPDVAAHLRARLPAADWTVELRAVDGSIVSQVPAQLAAAAIGPSDVLVMSAGGNDALASISLLSDPAAYTISQVLAHLYTVKESFRAAYAATLDALLSYGRPAVVCTVYNPQFDEELLQHTAEAALSIFNDVIMQEAVRRRVPMIDLRLICTERAHFANPIEPSNEGGARIAEAIAAATRLASPR
ncbi:MAG TPA: SGNH/GDSL hydrolase family protein [Candidatus Acidoferrum sp.]|nr:SGNH/GDSL hydrolase family protein [Candidatus Acidoferrum sp.]